jgi:peroxiredoxin
LDKVSDPPYPDLASPRPRSRRASTTWTIVRIGPPCLGRSFPKNDRPERSFAYRFTCDMTLKKGRKEGTFMATELTVGAKAPAFKLPRDGGGTVSLADFKGRTLVIYAYPRADTPGCTRESIDFSKLRAEFHKADTDILGVSADPVESQDKFKKKHKLGLALLSDETHKMLEAYGAWGKKSMYGKTFMGIIRSTVLIDAAGRIARIWPKVKVDGHAAEVLAAAKEL